ncbi:hypothetical protein [Fimbriiglobus ruber]|nr:hypothetical protein [Fimbriiglobus ruber]
MTHHLSARARIVLGLACAVGLLSPTASRGQGFIEHITPPVVERGKMTRVAFVGRDMGHALDIWNSLPAGAVRARPVESRADRAVFDVEVALDAPVGVCGVRVATVDGLSNAHLFLVDDLPVQNLTASATPTKVALPAAIAGTFREATVDRYQIDVAAGQRVSFEVVGSRFGKDADPLVTIRDSRGAIQCEHDNDPGLSFDCRFEHQFRAAGTYTVEVNDARFRGSEHHQYVLRMGRFPAARVAVPSAVRPGPNELRLPEIGGPAISYTAPTDRLTGPFFAALKRPGDEGSTWVSLTTTDGAVTVARERDLVKERAQAASASSATTFAVALSPLRVNPFLGLDAFLLTGRAQATPAVVPGVLCGVLARPGERHTFALELAKGQSIYVRSEGRGLQSPADVEVTLTDRVGRELRRSTDDRDDATNLEFTANTAGLYGLTVHDQARDGGAAFAYRITVGDRPFPPLLVAEVEGLTIPRQSYQPIPITVTRGAARGTIKLTLLGAPPGLTLAPDEIGEKDTAIVCKLSAGSEASIGLHTIQIVAETKFEPTGPVIRTLVHTRPLIDRQLVNVDLIPHALREDQRRLPPGLAYRFAVQVTPPAPFAMELPEPAVTLARYQRAEFPIVVTRNPGFGGPVRFTAKGGQIAPKTEGRTRVYAEFPDATTASPRVTGVIVSKILANIGKVRVEVSGTGESDGRRTTLTRTFDLNLTTAFTVTAEPAKVSLLAGQTAKVRIVVERVKTFDGAVTVKWQPVPGLSFPESITVPKGQTGAEIEVRAAADAAPGRYNTQARAEGLVDGFEEDQRGGAFEIEIRKPDEPKKK